MKNNNKTNSVQTQNFASLPAIEPGIIRTFTGIYINVFNPKPEDICIEDIAHALSNLCRFSGHTVQFYSVAEHSIRVAELVEPQHKLAALLHDASEAYLLDIPTPIKSLFPEYSKAENKLMEVIAEKFGFEYPLPAEVKLADKAMLEFEWFEQMDVQEQYWAWDNQNARAAFLVAFDGINLAIENEKAGYRTQKVFDIIELNKLTVFALLCLASSYGIDINISRQDIIYGILNAQHEESKKQVK